MDQWKSINRDPSKPLKKSFHLVIGGGLDEYRCPDCGALLLKGKGLEKSIVEVKCRHCKAIVSNGRLVI